MRGPPAVNCHLNLQREILEVSLNLLIDNFPMNISKFCLNTYNVYHSGQILLKVNICVISILIKEYQSQVFDDFGRIKVSLTLSAATVLLIILYSFR